MLVITLPDGTEKSFESAITVQKLAESIGPGLAKVAIAGVVEDKLVDLSHEITADANVRIITGKDDEGVEIIRHSTAHLLAQAVKSLFPKAQVTIGPVIESGFYYDFAFERTFTPEDLAAIEKKMLELAKLEQAVTRKELSRDEAIDLFAGMGEDYKVQIIKDLPEGDTLTAYQQSDFIDLCRGPHVPNTKFLQAFKLTKLAGAYWRGDSNNEMLQRVYGTAWPDKKALKQHLHRIEEAEKRDHRVLAKKMDLFHLQPEAPGMIFWHPNGWSIVCTIRQYIRELLIRCGYQEINTPQLVDGILWEQSGHKAKFDDDMFVVESESREYIVKPMSCPCHVQIFKQGVKSYRDLPVRYAEFGCCHRNEPSGTLHGLMRLRGFVQDDGHIFCSRDQVREETAAFIKQTHEFYKKFGFTEIIHKLSMRPEKRVGSDELWDEAEATLKQALDDCGAKWDLQPGEGAFYGPKIEFSLKDCLGRVWQCGTLQLDPFTAERLGANFIAEDGSKQPPVMLHRAMMGSTERFLGILLEEYAGKLPIWLAPVQVVVMNITDAQADYVKQIQQELQNRGIRAKLDLRNEKIGFKIREHTIARIPYQVVIGDRELESKTLAVRGPDGTQTASLSFEDLVARIR